MTPTNPPSNIVHQGLPSRSALRVATLRAVHSLLDEPLVLHDPVALPLLGQDAEAQLREDPFVHNDPPSRTLRAVLVARSRFVEDELARAVQEDGVRQYVLLGAGLDTFAYRNVHESRGLQVFEVDHPSTQQWKRSLLQQARIAVPASVRYAAADFEREDALPRALADAGFDPEQPACFSWMGVTMYLTREAVMHTLGWGASLPVGSRVCFDYNVPFSQLEPVQRVIMEAMAGRMALVGEPWVSSFESEKLVEDLIRLGFREAQFLTPEAMNARWLARRKDGLCTGGAIRLMCARR